MKLITEATVTINGVAVTLGAGTEIQFPINTPEASLEFASLTKLPVDLSYTKGGVKYIAGAGGKFVAVPKVAKAVTAKAPKAKA